MIWGKGLGFCPFLGEVLESGASCHVTAYSPLWSPQHWSKLYFRVSPRLQANKRVWGWGIASSLYGDWMGCLYAYYTYIHVMISSIKEAINLKSLIEEYIKIFIGWKQDMA